MTLSFIQAYSQVTWPISPKFTVSGGLNFDSSPDDNEFFDTNHRLTKWSPQAGLLFRPTHSTTMRAIYLEGVQTHEKERLAPTHLFGFPVQANNLRYTDAREVARLLKDIGIPVTLKELGLPEDKQDWTAESAIGAARLVNNNPRKLDVDAMKAITRAAFTGDRATLAS